MRDQKISDWLAWKKLCALDLCDAEAQSALREFLWDQGSRLSSKMHVSLEACLGGRAKGAETLWAYLEHRSLAGTHKSGKCYKDWIFSYAEAKPNEQQALSSILQGVKLQLQMVLRGVLAEEFAQKMEYRRGRVEQGTAREPLNDSPDAWIEGIAHRAAELLRPSPMMLVRPEERVDFEQIADDVAAEWWVVLTHLDKIVLGAKLRGISLAEQRVVKAAKAGKTRLYESLKAQEEWLLEKIAKYQEDAPGAQYLRAAILSKLLDKIEIWEKAENPFGVGFRESE